MNAIPRPFVSLLLLFRIDAVSQELHEFREDISREFLYRIDEMSSNSVWKFSGSFRMEFNKNLFFVARKLEIQAQLPGSVR